MKNTIKNGMTVLGIALMVAISFYGWMAYETRFKITYIGTEQAPDGETQVIFQMLGEPTRQMGDGSYGATGGRAIVKQGDTEIKAVSFEVSNEGAALSEENWEVTFFPERVEIRLKGGAGEETETLTVYLDGSVEGRGADGT